ncbi:MAG: penicillin-binding transpeptidase domain-containing protein [Candidatus Omnitrophota bacterium]
MRTDFRRRRQIGALFFVTIIFLFLILRLFNRQVINYEAFKKKADIQQKVNIKLPPPRGNIYDAAGNILALDTSVDSVYAVPREIEDKQEVVSQLESALGMDRAFLKDRLSRDKSFVWIKRKIGADDVRRIEKADIEGVGMVKEPRRSYPVSNLLCHAVGFTDIDNNGLEGLELYYEPFLEGKTGFKSTFRDARQRIVSSYDDYLPPKEGCDLKLGMDEVIQHIIVSEINRVVEDYRPRSVMIVALDPKTGQVLGMANYPDFDPNRYWEAEQDDYRNRCITDVFEPGSVFKIITASAVLEEDVVSPDDEFYCENGEYRVGSRVLHDYRPYGTLTFRQVIEKSSNIGTVKAAAKLGPDKLYEYILKFGFGARSGIDLPSEENGILRHKNGWTPSDMTTIPMGQGISCTALQLACAVSVIANGGLLVRPYVVQYITDSADNTISESAPHIERRVVSENTARVMRDFLCGVVEEGTGRRAKPAGYRACGKTGTAQKVGEGGRYSPDKYVASFVGFAPYENPKVALVVCVDEPKGNHFGGVVAAPVFKRIIEKILKYMEISRHEKA